MQTDTIYEHIQFSLKSKNKKFDLVAMQNWLEQKSAIQIKQGGGGKEGEERKKKRLLHQQRSDGLDLSVSLIMFIVREVIQNNSSVCKRDASYQ